MPPWLFSELHTLIAIAKPILSEYGLPAVFLIVFGESAGVFFAPGESVVVAAGFLAGQGVFPVWLAFILMVSGAALGGFAAYLLGAKYGHDVLLKYGKYVLIRPAMLDRAHHFFQRFGPPVVFVGRFIVPLRQLQGWMVGASEMGWKAFALWSTLGAFLWVLVWGGAGFLLAGAVG